MGPGARLAVDAGGLYFGVPAWRRGPRLRFAPDSAELHRNGVVQPLAWGDVLGPMDYWEGAQIVYGHHWAITGPGRYQTTAVTCGDAAYRVGRLVTGLPIGMSASAATSALCAYLRDVDAARAKLTDAQATTSIVASLRGHSWLARDHTPVAGARLDVSRHLLRAIDSLGAHCYLGRLVDGEVLPQTSEVVEVVRSGLPSWVKGGSATPEGIAKRYERILELRRWPFGILTR